jgi:hypothetical protein
MPKKNDGRLVSSSTSVDNISPNSTIYGKHVAKVVLDNGQTASGRGTSKIDAIGNATRIARGETKQCFPAHTKILTPSGEREIASLRVGDRVCSWSPHGLTVQTVTALRVRGMGEVVKVGFAQGLPLLVTRHHTVHTARGWRRVGELRTGDQLTSSDGSARIVNDIVSIGREPVFGLRTTGEHTFIAEGLVAHNFTELRRLRTLLHRLFIDWRFHGYGSKATARWNSRATSSDTTLEPLLSGP